MEELDTIFTIPTYRLRDVPETIERYDENFWRNGHEVALFVFDDSSLANHDKYYSQLGKTRTANPLYYVGPREKERFIQILLQRLREPKLESLVCSTKLDSIGFVKLGQPVPLSNLSRLSNSGVSLQTEK